MLVGFTLIDFQRNTAKYRFMIKGEAMEVIKRGLEKEGDAEFLNVGKFNKTHKGAANMYGIYEF